MSKKDYPSNAGFKYYYCDKRVKKYITQFMSIFAGLQVDISKEDEEQKLTYVPIRYAHGDRVVEAIIAKNTQNLNMRLPIMSTMITGFELDRERVSGLNQVKTTVETPYGGTLDDTKSVTTLKPLPYRMTMELNLYASNTDQHFQMLEQILLPFDPTLQIQVSSDATNATSITDVELDNVGMENNYPIDEGQRIISSTLTFTVHMHLTAPANVRNNVIQKIRLRVQACNNIDTDFDEDVFSSEEGFDTILDATGISLD